MKPFYIFLALVVSFLWGVSPVIQKHLLNKFDKYTLMLLFSSANLVCVTSLLTFHNKALYADIKTIQTNDALLIFAYSFFTIFLANLIILEVLKHNNTYVVAAIEGTYPLFTLLLVYLFFKEKITVVGVGGVILIVLGIICLSLNESTFKMEEFVGIR